MTVRAIRNKRCRLLPPGKLPHDLLKKMLSQFDEKNPDVVLGPGIGIDAAVVRLPHKYLAITSDPITLAGDLAAYYCVHVNANDLAVIGAVPQFMTIVGLCPPSSPTFVEQISRDLARFARELHVTIVGGHTEITTTVNTPILIATMFGPMVSKKMISSATAQPGDVVVTTKTAGLEATAIIARERGTELKKAGFAPATISKMQRLLFKPGISILPEAQLAIRAGCSAMHDATEGGILTGLWEIADASKVRMVIESENIPLLPETKDACKIWKIDPLRAISSGALLVTIPQRKVTRLMNLLAGAKISATVLGRISEGPGELVDKTTGQCFLPSKDEISKIY